MYENIDRGLLASTFQVTINNHSNVLIINLGFVTIIKFQLVLYFMVRTERKAMNVLQKRMNR